MVMNPIDKPKTPVQVTVTGYKFNIYKKYSTFYSPVLSSISGGYSVTISRVNHSVPLSLITSCV